MLLVGTRVLVVLQRGGEDHAEDRVRGLNSMADTVIRGGTIVDGNGGKPYVGDVAITGGKISGVGPKLSVEAQEVIDATGLLVCPGWVDVHTHYDAQVAWDPTLSPSCFHGVTTVVFGNCGVTFAPCWKDDHDFLVELMEGVEE